MTDEPKAPGADITDGATGKPYMQADEKSAGQQAYEKHRETKEGGALIWPPWDELGAAGQEGWEYSAAHEKSAGQLAYEGERVGFKYVPWAELDAKAQAKFEFNATCTPKAQSIKAP